MFIIYATLSESISFGYYFFYCIEYIVIDRTIFIFAIYFKCILLMIFLCMENRTEWKHRYFVFIRFLLNRYEGKSSIRGVRPIAVPAQSSLMQVFALFKRGKKHPIYITYPNNERRSIDENDCLRSYFHEK